MIGFDSIRALFLQRISTDFIHQTNAAPFLTEIEQDAATFFGDALKGAFQLGTAVTALTEQGVTRQALGVQPRQYGLAITNIAQNHSEMFFASSGFKKCVQGKACPRRWQRTAGHVGQTRVIGAGGTLRHLGVPASRRLNANAASRTLATAACRTSAAIMPLRGDGGRLIHRRSANLVFHTSWSEGKRFSGQIEQQQLCVFCLIKNQLTFL
jgi:hypothetical protein